MVDITLMTLNEKVDALALVAGTNAGQSLALIAGIRTDLTALQSLEATHQQSLAASLTTLQAQFNSLDLTALIADGVLAPNKTWSSTKISAAILASVTQILGGAAAAGDTLGELLAMIDADKTGIAGILAVQSKSVRVDTDQTGVFTGPQMSQGRANIGAAAQADLLAQAAVVGHVPNKDFAATFTAAKTAALAA
jgi:hypothetical protein